MKFRNSVIYESISAQEVKKDAASNPGHPFGAPFAPDHGTDVSGFKFRRVSTIFNFAPRGKV
jgi:hypothetical protein